VGGEIRHNAPSELAVPKNRRIASPAEPATPKPSRPEPRRRPPDDVDLQLLGLLRADARTSVVALGRALHLGNATVHERLRRLQRDGFIQGFHADLDYDRLGLSLTAYVGLQIPQGPDARTRVAENLRTMPEVEDFCWLTGDLDALIRVRARDTAHLQRIVFGLIGAGGRGQIRTRTMVVLSEPFRKPGPDLEALASGE
jgi:Lrp/AsnC family leucine-responsive transcriptional regulator